MAKKLEIIIENFKKLRETNNIECKLSKTSFPKEALKTYLLLPILMVVS